jgi:hypothetical protein
MSPANLAYRNIHLKQPSNINGSCLPTNKLHWDGCAMKTAQKSVQALPRTRTSACSVCSASTRDISLLGTFTFSSSSHDRKITLMNCVCGDVPHNASKPVVYGFLVASLEAFWIFGYCAVAEIGKDSRYKSDPFPES